MRERSSSEVDNMSQSTNRGVSDVIAFILVFSIIITSVGFVYTVGFGSLIELQQGEQDANAERSMSAFAVGMDDILKERASDRAADIDLAGETIVVQDEDEYQLNVTVDDGSDTEVMINGSLVYGFGSDTQVIYMGGAVIRNDPSGAVVTRGPRFTCRDDDRASITAPSISDDGQGGISADGSVRVEAGLDADRRESTLSYPETPTDNGEVEQINVTVEAAPDDVERAWEQWFERQDEWDDDGTCDLNGDGTVFVRNPELEISYIL